MVSERRVVVTGLGMVTPLGVTVASTWDGIVNGKSGVRPITQFDTSMFPTKFAASVPNFDPEQYLSAKDARKFDLFVLYGVAAAAQAMQDANLVVTEQNSHRIGVAIGSGIGGIPGLKKHIKLYRRWPYVAYHHFLFLVPSLIWLQVMFPFNMDCRA